MTTRACLFCKVGKPLTKEHVYPRWLYRAMNIRGPIKVASDGGSERRAVNLDIQVRAVCKSCNEGWLHDLEGAMRSIVIPAFHRYPISLDQGRQRVVATWAVKTWLLAEYAHGHVREAWFESTETLNYLWEHREPPPGVVVRLGGVDSEFRQIASLSSSFIWGLDQEPPVGTIAVLTIGDLVFHLYFPIARQRLIVGRDLTTYLTQIWPSETAEVGWPPASVLTLDGLSRLTPTERIGNRPPPDQQAPPDSSNS